jgi:peptidyl-prolyl cis-trans isomerase C
MPGNRPTALVLLVALGLLIASCERKPADDSKVLATVNGETITENDYENFLRLRQSQGQQEPMADKEEERKAVLNELIDRVVLTQHAVEQKLDQDPEVYYLLRRVRENILAQALIRQALRDSPITDEDLKKRFEQETENTHQTEYRVRHILVQTEDEGKALIGQLEKGADFAALAKQKSVDTESGRDGGDLEWINQGAVVPEFFDAVKELKKGEISKAPVKSQFGWHVIRVDDTRALKLPTFEEFVANRQARANLHRRLQDERINAMVADLRAKAKITTD